MSDYVIETKDLSRDYGQFRALDKVNLAIETDRVVALLGPNGAGKTTLIHLLMGMLEPTEGRSSVLGVDSRKMAEQMAGQIGYMGDGDEPPGWMSIEALISLQAGASKSFDRGFIEKMLGDKEISVNKLFGAMSKGQKKWVRAGLSLASRPELLIMDEPAEGLDPSARHDLYDHLREYITDCGASAIVATHVIGDIERIADDVAIIHKGNLITYSCLEDLREQVCEVYMPGDSLPDQIEGRLEVIGKKKILDGTLFWMWCKNIRDDELKNLLPAQATIGHVDLQTFYMAMTENNLSKEML